MSDVSTIDVKSRHRVNLDESRSVFRMCLKIVLLLGAVNAEVLGSARQDSIDARLATRLAQCAVDYVVADEYCRDIARGQSILLDMHAPPTVPQGHNICFLRDSLSRVLFDDIGRTIVVLTAVYTRAVGELPEVGSVAGLSSTITTVYVVDSVTKHVMPANGAHALLGRSLAKIKGSAKFNIRNVVFDWFQTTAMLHDPIYGPMYVLSESTDLPSLGHLRVTLDSLTNLIVAFRDEIKRDIDRILSDSMYRPLPACKKNNSLHFMMFPGAYVYMGCIWDFDVFVKFLCSLEEDAISAPPFYRTNCEEQVLKKYPVLHAYRAVRLRPIDR